MTTTDGAAETPLLTAMLNLTAAHRAHEQFYGSEPRSQAVTLQRHARTLQALADRWTTATPSSTPAFSPYEGARDLNAAAATQLDGVLFMEGEGEPGEITHFVRDLRTFADDAAGAGEWLATAMQASWEVATALLDIDELADQLGERHRIIANDWQGASLMSLAARILRRAVDVLDRVDFTPAAVRADLARDGASPRRLYSAAELIDHAADLFSEFAGLVHANERRWRIFRARVAEYAATLGVTDPDATA